MSLRCGDGAAMAVRVRPLPLRGTEPKLGDKAANGPREGNQGRGSGDRVPTARVGLEGGDLRAAPTPPSVSQHFSYRSPERWGQGGEAWAVCFMCLPGVLVCAHPFLCLCWACWVPGWSPVPPIPVGSSP